MSIKTSVGAVLCTVRPQDNAFGIILGYEKFNKETQKKLYYDGYWSPFKGQPKDEDNGDLKNTAIREVFEETCGIVKLKYDDIDFCYYKGPDKEKYGFESELHLALVRVSYDLLDKFKKRRPLQKIRDYREKENLAFFPLGSIKYYHIERNINSMNCKPHDIVVSRVVSSFIQRSETASLLSWLCNKTKSYELGNGFIDIVFPIESLKNASVKYLTKKICCKCRKMKPHIESMVGVLI